MTFKKKIGLGFAATATAMLVAIAPAGADAIGVAVGAFGSTTPVGLPTVSMSALGGDGAIKYYIPLNDRGGGVYGTNGIGNACGSSGFGTCSDFGNGGATLQMILMFAPVSTTSPSTLTIKFQDLDVSGANDPGGLLESLNVLKWNGTQALSILPGGNSITSLGTLLSGNNDYQTLTLSLGTLTTSPLYLDLKFRASSNFNLTNTEEFLRATVSSSPSSSVPVPGPAVGAGIPGIIAAFGALIAYVRRRRSRQPAPATTSDRP